MNVAGVAFYKTFICRKLWIANEKNLHANATEGKYSLILNVRENKIYNDIITVLRSETIFIFLSYIV